jgi:hypothetical protein
MNISKKLHPKGMANINFNQMLTLTVIYIYSHKMSSRYRMKGKWLRKPKITLLAQPLYGHTLSFSERKKKN